MQPHIEVAEAYEYLLHQMSQLLSEAILLRLLLGGNQSSVIRHQSSVISHQALVIGHRPSAISHQPSAISHQRGTAKCNGRSNDKE